MLLASGCHPDELTCMYVRVRVCVFVCVFRYPQVNRYYECMVSGEEFTQIPKHRLRRRGGHESWPEDEWLDEDAQQPRLPRGRSRRKANVRGKRCAERRRASGSSSGRSSASSTRPSPSPSPSQSRSLTPSRPARSSSSSKSPRSSSATTGSAATSPEREVPSSDPLQLRRPTAAEATAGSAPSSSSAALPPAPPPPHPEARPPRGTSSRQAGYCDPHVWSAMGPSQACGASRYGLAQGCMCNHRSIWRGNIFGGESRIACGSLVANTGQ